MNKVGQERVSPEGLAAMRDFGAANRNCLGKGITGVEAGKLAEAAKTVTAKAPDTATARAAGRYLKRYGRYVKDN